MARDLVTLAQASEHLRRDTEDDNADLQLKITAASRRVLQYLGDQAEFLDSNGDVPVDSNGDPVDVPEHVQAATLLLIGDLYEQREGGQTASVDSKFGYGYLPVGVVALLYQSRDPVIA